MLYLCMTLPSLSGIDVILSGSCDHVICSRTESTDMASSESSITSVRVASQMEYIIDIRFVLQPPLMYVITCVTVIPYREYDVPYHVRVAIDLKINVVCYVKISVLHLQKGITHSLKNAYNTNKQYSHTV